MKKYLLIASFLAIILLSVLGVAVEEVDNETTNNETTENNTKIIFEVHEDAIKSNTLAVGKNDHTTHNLFEPIYVKDFVRLYPDIEAVSYKVDDETKGFINFLDGIGENFIMYPNKKYEIITKQEFTVGIS